MPVTTREQVQPKAARLTKTMRRIDLALDRRDEKEFMAACKERDRIVQELVLEVELKGFVQFH